jgi:hypothetical protein
MDLWENLLSEIGASYMALIALHNDKNVSAAAWMTRNLLELTVWAASCVQSRDAAKRFYDDKARDVFDFLDAVEGLAKLGEKTDISISDLVQTTRKRIANSAQSEGYEGLDESYQRVHEAAKQVGLAAFFRSMTPTPTSTTDIRWKLPSGRRWHHLLQFSFSAAH